MSGVKGRGSDRP